MIHRLNSSFAPTRHHLPPFILPPPPPFLKKIIINVIAFFWALQTRHGNIFDSVGNFSRASLLAYSPMAMGILSGKYLSPDGGPSDARMNLFRG